MSLTGPDGRQIAKYDDFQHNRRMRELFARAQEVTKAAMKAKASFEKKSTEEEKPKELQTEVAGGGKSLNYSSIKGVALGVAALSIGLLEFVQRPRQCGQGAGRCHVHQGRPVSV